MAWLLFDGGPNWNSETFPKLTWKNNTDGEQERHYIRKWITTIRDEMWQDSNKKRVTENREANGTTSNVLVEQEIQFYRIEESTLEEGDEKGKEFGTGSWRVNPRVQPSTKVFMPQTTARLDMIRPYASTVLSTLMDENKATNLVNPCSWTGWVSNLDFSATNACTCAESI